jgi:hypothetical protein
MGQQFGLSQQSSFQDQAPQPVPPHLPHNFPNMGISNPSQVQQMLNSRSMLSFQTNNSGHMPRQLEMIGLAPNQQQQNGPMNYATRMTQQHQHQPNMNTQPNQNQPLQSDIFSSPQPATSDSIRSSPSHSSQPGSLANHLPVAQQNPQGLPPGRRSMTIQELAERAQQIRRAIEVDNDLIAQLSAQRAGMSDAIYINKMQSLTNDANVHKDLLNKLLYAMNQMTANGLSGGSGPSGRNGGNM